MSQALQSLLILFLTLLISCKQETAMSTPSPEKPEPKQASSETTNPAVAISAKVTLTAEEAAIIIHKGTERPYTGEYNEHFAKGLYLCKQCRTPLYRSETKFKAHCGWPAFDNEIAGAVKHTVDADGRRTEITCMKCDGHLGHVFVGERLTATNSRHCVNSLSMSFVATEKLGRAIFASGCFWGTEFFLQKAPGVLQTTVGYIGGSKDFPTY